MGGGGGFEVESGGIWQVNRQLKNKKWKSKLFSLCRRRGLSPLVFSQFGCFVESRRGTGWTLFNTCGHPLGTSCHADHRGGQVSRGSNAAWWSFHSMEASDSWQTNTYLSTCRSSSCLFIHPSSIYPSIIYINLCTYLSIYHLSACLSFYLPIYHLSIIFSVLFGSIGDWIQSPKHVLLNDDFSSICYLSCM